MTNPPTITVSAAAPVQRVSYPIDFALLDDDGLAVLVITDDPAEQHAHLEITNTSGADLLFDPPPAGSTATPDLYHFELLFRPSVLATVSVAQMRMAPQDGWSATAPQRQPDGTVSMYLLCTGAPALAARLAGLEWVVTVERDAQGLRVDTTSLYAGETLLPAEIAASGAELIAFNPVGADLETVFLSMVDDVAEVGS